MVVDADAAGPSPPSPLLSKVFVSAAAPLFPAVCAAPEDVTVALIYQGELADSSQIFSVRGADARTLGIVQLSSELSPDMVARGVLRARAAADCMGPALGRAVLLPLVEREVEGRSYAVMPYGLRFATERWRWALERLRLRPVVLDWLHDVTAATLAPVPKDQIDPRFRHPLAQLREIEGASELLVACVDRALSRLASGTWTPRHVLMHGDLWKGNLLLRPWSGSGFALSNLRWSERLTVIDWAGSQPRGYAFFDLVRVVESLKVGTRRLRVEVDRHCALLGCEPVDAPAYVLAALGAILGDIEHFPLPRLRAMAESTLQCIESAVEPLHARTMPPGAG